MCCIHDSKKNNDDDDDDVADISDTEITNFMRIPYRGAASCYYICIQCFCVHHRMGRQGEYKYQDGSLYNGQWNEHGHRHGYGHLAFPDGNNYWGFFDNGLYGGLGVMVFQDGSRLLLFLVYYMFIQTHEFQWSLPHFALKDI